MKHAGLTTRQLRFVQALLADPEMNQRRAAIAAGYSEATARQQGTNLVKITAVKAAIEIALEERKNRSIISADEVITFLAKIIRADPRKMFREAIYDDYGNTLVRADLKQISEMDDDTVLLVGGFDFVSIKNKQGDETGYIAKVRFKDQIAAARLLAQHLGLLVEPEKTEKSDFGKSAQDAKLLAQINDTTDPKKAADAYYRLVNG